MDFAARMHPGCKSNARKRESWQFNIIKPRSPSAGLIHQSTPGARHWGSDGSRGRIRSRLQSRQWAAGRELSGRTGAKGRAAMALTANIRAEGFLEGSTYPPPSSHYCALPADTLWGRSGRRAGEKSRDPNWL